jgi:antitoxin YefM
MNSISYTYARAHLAKTMQKVCEDHSAITITRSQAEPVVMLSLADYEALQETNYLLKSPKNATRLNESIDEIEALIAKKKKTDKRK